MDPMVKDHKHGLSTSEADTVLTLLRACAWAQPGDFILMLYIAYNYTV